MPAGSPMDLSMAAQDIPPVEDISPRPSSLLALALASIHDFQTPDPFEGSALSGFRLLVVGSMLATLHQWFTSILQQVGIVAPCVHQGWPGHLQQ